MSKRGGARRGAGRKRSAVTKLKELALANAAGEAEASLAFVVSVRKNTKHPIAIRFAAAIDIMDRVWGRAKQRTELTGARGGAIRTASDSRIDKFLEGKSDEELAKFVAAASSNGG